jgi:hypothetical protein
MNPKHLFILCPPASGSTLLWKLLQTSPRVSALPSEGQSLVPDILFGPDRWNPELPVPWAEVEKKWRSVWDLGKPVLLEKSPPHLVRAGQLERHFSDSYFIVMVRNPYASCEGIKRRWGRSYSYYHLAKFWAICAAHQIDNIRRLRRALWLTYEDLTADPDSSCRRFLEFLPEIGELDDGRIFRVFEKSMRITDLNPSQISNLAEDDVYEINRQLKRYPDLMAILKYPYQAAAPGGFRFRCRKTISIGITSLIRRPDPLRYHKPSIRRMLETTD